MTQTAEELFKKEATELKEKVAFKIREVINSKLPSELSRMLRDMCILSGSSIASIYHGEDPKDYDLWSAVDLQVPSIRDCILANPVFICEASSDKYTAQQFGIDTNEKLITPNAITMVGKIQFITLGDYNFCRKSFDYVHCLPYYDIRNNKFSISPQQLYAIKHKKLIKTGYNEPKTWRTEKFKSRGWTLA